MDAGINTDDYHFRSIFAATYSAAVARTATEKMTVTATRNVGQALQIRA